MFLFFRLKWYQLKRFLDGLSVNTCGNCGKFMFERNSTYKEMTTGWRVPICRQCLLDLYNEKFGEKELWD